MSGIFGVLSFDGRPESDSVAQDILRAVRRRGGDQVAVWQKGGALLGVCRFDWERDPGFAGPDLVLEDGDLVVAADATLYYRDELRRRLASAGVATGGRSASELILAAYRAWGPGCAGEIEGDFAFVIWDRRLRRVVCSRDHSGVRPLFHARTGDTLVLASTLGGVLAHPGVSQELDLANIALEAAGIVFAATNSTCYQAIQAVPAGATAVWNGSGQMQLDHWWDPQTSSAPRPVPAAADELRSILGDAVEQRFATDASTALWLSGGWDSSSIFAVGRQRLGDRGDRIRPVSMDYPEGHSGRETEMVQAMLDHWNSGAEWVDGGSIPLIEVEESYARRRDEPFPFYFENWMRYLARSTHATDARAVITGHGGNFLFASSHVFLSDLLASGRWPTLWREWRALRVQRGERRRHFLRWAVQPLLPAPVRGLVEHLRGRPLLGTYERPVPTWLASDFVARHGILERARGATPPVAGRDRSGSELRWFMTHPMFARVYAQSFEVTLAEGIEQRAPLFDARLIRFVAGGPWSERYSQAGTKRLLRHAMRGLLPEAVLADRFGRRDGTLRTYVEQSVEALWPTIRRLLERPILADLGIVDPDVLRRQMDRYGSKGGHHYVPEQLLSAAHVESWFRAREAGQSSEDTVQEVPVFGIA